MFVYTRVPLQTRKTIKVSIRLKRSKYLYTSVDLGSTLRRYMLYYFMKQENAVFIRKYTRKYMYLLKARSIPIRRSAIQRSLYVLVLFKIRQKFYVQSPT